MTIEDTKKNVSNHDEATLQQDEIENIDPNEEVNANSDSINKYEEKFGTFFPPCLFWILTFHGICGDAHY